MGCNICGTEKGIKYYRSKLQTMCRACAKDTPAKVGRRTFLRRYFGPFFREVDHSTMNEFYSDYLASGHTLTAYVETTTTEIL